MKMADNDDFELKLQRLINKVLGERKLWEQRRHEAEERINTLDTRLEAYQATLKDYWESIDNVVAMKQEHRNNK